MSPPNPPLPKPAVRKLRVYAFDPHASLDLGSAKYSHAVISLAWEDPTDEDPLSPGPVNDYLEVIDVDPASRQFYEPLDLNAPEVLGQEGLPPSEGDPRFHQQMVFAVVMKTIKLFERALGRKVLWRPEWDNVRKTYVPTRKLRVYPHAIREANAYYSPEKRALLFGYFSASQRSAGANWIFTVLSHDIIVHETTHAILDGLHPRYSEPTSPDSLAFHEAFADIAALFSHFQLYEAVYDFIDSSNGRLDQSALLSGLAGQFAKGTTGRKSLRSYIDAKADAPAQLEDTSEPHDRGAILVAAVFDAFLSIYTARTEDLLRISGAQLGAGQHLHPDLVARLTKEATKSADHVLRMCIRALDYLPPVDVRFGEFLRAIITADADLIPDDRLNYRLAFVEAFRRRGIFPDACLSMSPDNLLWDPPPAELATDDIVTLSLELMPIYRRSEISAVAERNRRKIWYWLIQPQIRPKDHADEARLLSFLNAARDHFADRPEATKGISKAAARRMALDFVDRMTPDLLHFGAPRRVVREFRKAVTDGLTHFQQWESFVDMLLTHATGLETVPDLDEAWEKALGLYFQRPSVRALSRGDPPSNPPPSPLSTIKGDRSGLVVEVHSVRATRRAGPDGQDLRQLVIEVTQRRQGYFDPSKQAERDRAPPKDDAVEPGDFVFRGGATLIIDLRDGKLRYLIRKSIDDDARLDLQRRVLLDPTALSFTYSQGSGRAEPFALLHRH